MSDIKKQIYVSIDVECDGPIPGEYSMLSLGAYAIDETGEEYGSFYRTIEPIPGAQQHPDTMVWWRGCPKAFAEATKDPERPQKVMKEFAGWLNNLKAHGQVQMIAYPAGFDFTFVHYYLVRYAGRNPLSFHCLDMKTFAMAKLGIPYKEVSKRSMPQAWKRGLPKHTHNALDDAKEQAMLFVKMLEHKG